MAASRITTTGLEAYIIEVRNEGRRLNWRPLPTEKVYTLVKCAERALERVRDVYGHQGFEYRLMTYRRVE